MRVCGGWGVCLAVRIGAFEGGQKPVVDVDHIFPVPLQERAGQHLRRPAENDREKWKGLRLSRTAAGTCRIEFTSIRIS